MRVKGAHWNVVLTPDAERDFFEILRWTRANFGARQTQAYRVTLREAIMVLHDGPSTLGVRQRDDLGPGIHTLHVARNGRKGRHFIVFRAGGGPTIDVLRLLHDSMELSARLAE
ncbi:MAG: type II toxin-antitoxin system RelE/ParE family toxin [Acidovorax sp.]|uniref:type II toxin-antitoxin system RelE/ParE family toxin n=1 Tax=Acidovorax sp. TaxID=1872122 RepID=UPI0039E4FFC6